MVHVCISYSPRSVVITTVSRLSLSSVFIDCTITDTCMYNWLCNQSYVYLSAEHNNHNIDEQTAPYHPFKHQFHPPPQKNYQKPSTTSTTSTASTTNTTTYTTTTVTASIRENQTIKNVNDTPSPPQPN